MCFVFSVVVNGFVGPWFRVRVKLNLWVRTSRAGSRSQCRGSRQGREVRSGQVR